MLDGGGGKIVEGVYEGATKNTYGCPLKITSLRWHQTGVIIKREIKKH